MERVGCKPPEDLGPNISVVKPIVAKFLLRLPKPGKSPAVLWFAWQWGRLALKLPYAKQTAPAMSSFFLLHTASLLLFRSRLSSYANSHSCALRDGFVRRFVWQIHRYTTGSHPRELPSVVRSLPHSIAGFTSWWHFIFFLALFKGDAFCNALCKTWTSGCLLGAGRHEIQIYATLLFGCSVKTLKLGGRASLNEFNLSLDR